MAVAEFIKRVGDRFSTDKDMAEALSRIGIDRGRGSVSSWKRGEGNPLAWYLFRMAREWDVSLDEFARAESLTHQVEILATTMARVIAWAEPLGLPAEDQAANG